MSVCVSWAYLLRQAGWHRRILFPVPAKLLGQDFCFFTEVRNVNSIYGLALCAEDITLLTEYQFDYNLKIKNNIHLFNIERN